MPADYIPRKNSDFANFQHNLVNKVSANATTWGISPADLGELVVASGKYNNHYKAISNKRARTMAQVAGHDEARKNFEKQLRLFVNAFIRGNAKITDEQMTGLGLARRRKKRKVREAMNEAPQLILQVLGGMQVKVFCRQPDTVGKASVHPESDGIELRYSLGTPATHVAQATEVLFTKKAKNLLRLPLDAQGKKLYVFARWLNLTHPNRSSPWSAVREVVVY